MRLVFKRLSDQLREMIEQAPRGRVIERIEVTRSEWDTLVAEKNQSFDGDYRADTIDATFMGYPVKVLSAQLTPP